MIKCFICGAEDEYGNNPFPLWDQELADREGIRCCDECNKLVVRARIELLATRKITDYIIGDVLNIFYSSNKDLEDKIKEALQKGTFLKRKIIDIKPNAIIIEGGYKLTKNDNFSLAT